MLELLSYRLKNKKIVILGVGNRLRGDDGAGSILASRLVGKISATVIDAEGVPENYIGPIINADPEVLMIIDAADMGVSPGDLAIIETDDIARSGISTHGASLNLLFLVIQSAIQPDIFILGIQPQSAKFGESLSLPVRNAIETAEKAFREILIYPAG